MAVPELVVVFLCVLAAGAVVVVGAAFGRHFLPGGNKAESEQRDWSQPTPEQESYMKKVRDMNQTGIFAQVRHDRYMSRNGARSASSQRHSGTGIGYESGSGYSGYAGHHGPQKGYAGSPLVYEDDGYSENGYAQGHNQGRWGTEVA